MESETVNTGRFRRIYVPRTHLVLLLARRRSGGVGRQGGGAQSDETDFAKVQSNGDALLCRPLREKTGRRNADVTRWRLKEAKRPENPWAGCNNGVLGVVYCTLTLSVVARS